jgi:glyoxylate/hydroxypyruvate reductase A
VKTLERMSHLTKKSDLMPPLNLLFAAPASEWVAYSDVLPTILAAEGIDATLSTDLAPEETDYILYAPGGPLTDFAPFTRAKAVLSLWAGVEKIVGNRTLTQPLARMVDPGLTEGMVEYVTAHVLRHHLDLDADIVNPAHAWTPRVPPLARERTVAILGLGELGGACATALAALRFNVLGYSRRPRTLSGIDCHSGDAGLRAVLRQAEILVLLLPSTPDTAGLINAERLALLPPGAMIVNPGRGALIDDDSLLAALDAGHIAHATLDVFRTEPLPPDHRYWSHPRVTITPHIAAATRATTAARVLVENIRRREAGQPLLHLVDRSTGY